MRSAPSLRDFITSRSSKSKNTPGNSKAAPAPDTFEPSSQEIQAANRIKAHLKTHMVRRRVVMPSQIQRYLKKNVGDFESNQNEIIDWRQLSHFIARELLSARQNPKRFEKFGKRYFGNEKPYRFPAFNKEHRFVQTVAMPLKTAAWLAIDNKKKSAELEIIGPYLGHGSVKMVHESRVLHIDLSNSEHKMDVFEAALVAQRPQSDVSSFLAGQRFLAQLSLKDPTLSTLKVAGNFTHTTRTLGMEIEARDRLFAGDLTSLQLSPRRILRAIGDVGMVLTYLHGLGLIHGDVKPENILISGRHARGFLNDFDFAKCFGLNNSGTIGFLDALGLRGYATPLMDIYGLAKTTALILFDVSLFEKDANGKEIDLCDDEIIERMNDRFASWKLKKQKRLMALKDNIIAVLKENKETKLVLNEDRELSRNLLAGSPEKKKAAASILLSRFQGFDRFLATLAKCC